MKIDFTFIITVYNGQNTIGATLESIKYQILQYGQGYSIQLIIGDDASTDLTREVIKIWLMENKNLFTKVDLLFHANNNGTCRNFVESLRCIEGAYFKELAGDDMLPVNNMFEVMKLTDKYDIVTGFVLLFSNNDPAKTLSYLKSNYIQKYYDTDSLRILTQTSCPIKNGAVWNKRLLSRSVLNFIAQYKYVEDRPMWFKIFQENPELKYYFNDKPTLLYRAEYGVTFSTNPYHALHDKDVKQLRMDINKMTRSVLVRVSNYLYCRPNRLWGCINPSVWYPKFLEIKHRDDLDIANNISIQKAIKENNGHLKKMIASGKTYTGKLNNNE